MGGADLRSRLSVLVSNVKLDCKNFACTNALAYIILTNRARTHKVVAHLRSRLSALVSNVKSYTVKTLLVQML